MKYEVDLFDNSEWIFFQRTAFLIANNNSEGTIENIARNCGQFSL